MGASQRIVSVSISLHYRHPLGALTPFFEALKAGEALATSCGDQVCFPPRLRANGEPPRWVKLTGQGTIVAFTHGAPEAAAGSLPSICALIAMDGATNMAIGRVSADSAVLQPGSRVKILASSPDVARAFPLAIEFAPT
jgi:uncharacterized OB-fold protein